jgi:predicted DNA-binding protein with PD1-like motif
MHIHLSVADGAGTVLGGHLLNGCLVFTTAEIVIGDISSEWHFERKLDDKTSYLELSLEKLGQ